MEQGGRPAQKYRMKREHGEKGGRYDSEQRSALDARQVRTAVSRPAHLKRPVGAKLRRYSGGMAEPGQQQEQHRRLDDKYIRAFGTKGGDRQSHRHHYGHRQAMGTAAPERLKSEKESRSYQR